MNEEIKSGVPQYHNDLIQQLQTQLNEANELLKDAWTKCENTGMWDILKISPSQCDCRYHRIKKYLEKYKVE